jgi:hypothetical protein
VRPDKVFEIESSCQFEIFRLDIDVILEIGIKSCVIEIESGQEFEQEIVFISGFGSALRSIFPFGFTGIVSIFVKCAGII